jgi:hypothetical protein
MTQKVSALKEFKKAKPQVEGENLGLLSHCIKTERGTTGN